MKQKKEKINNDICIDLQKVYDGTAFHRACVDTGAAKSVCGLHQAKTYFKSTNLSVKSEPSSSRFRFRDYVYDSKALITISIPINASEFVEFKADTLAADIPLLLELKDLKKNGKLLNYPENRAEHKIANNHFLITYKHDHSFWEWDYTHILITWTELQKFHLHFLHPSSEKLFHPL